MFHFHLLLLLSLIYLVLHLIHLLLHLLLFYLLFLFSLLFTFTTVIQIYFCIALGQLFQGHRVLFAIAFYFLTGFVVQLLTVLFMIAAGLFHDRVPVSSSLNLGQYTDSLYLMTGALSIVLAAAEYIATHYIMKRKINLI